MISDYKTAVKNIQSELKQYLLKSNLKSLVAGVSGGIDSALTVALARPVCDELGIKLICRSIPIETNKPEEILNARLTGEAFAHDFKEVDLSEYFKKLVPGIGEDFGTADKSEHGYKIRQGNIKARMRMMLLYDLASKHRGMVLSTDNYTELLLGFWTLHGDTGDYAMLQYLWKTEVYAMADFLVNEMSNSRKAEALQACMDAVPTDGLGITNSDLEQIGAASYAEVDQVLIRYLKNPNDADILNHKVVLRHKASEYKRANPFRPARETITDAPLF